MQPVLDQTNSKVRNVDTYPLPLQLLCGNNRRPTAAERVKHRIAFVAASLNDALQQGKRLLSGEAEAFGSVRIDDGDVPSVRHRCSSFAFGAARGLSYAILKICLLALALPSLRSPR